MQKITNELKFMKTYTISLVVVFALVALGLAAFLVAPDVIHGQSTPSFEVTNDPNPVLTGAGVTLSPAQVLNNQSVLIKVEAYDVSGLSTARALVKSQTGSTVATVPLFDNGQHNDGQAGDGIFAASWNVGSTAEGVYPIDVEIVDTLNNATYIDGVVQLAIGAGACVADADCSAGDVCCAGSCATSACSTDADCDDGDVSTTDTCDTSSCPLNCQYTLITTCMAGDNYCPAGCTIANDADCSDTGNPTIAFTTPAADGEDISAAGATTYVVSVDASDAESYIDRVEFYVNSESVARDTQIAPSPAGSTNYNWVLDVTSLGNGTHTLTARAYDGSSNSAVATRSVTVTVDTTAPFNVNITSPISGATFSSGSAFNAVVHAEDDASLTYIELFSTLGGGAFATTAGSGNFNTTTVDATIPVLVSSIAYLDFTFPQYAGAEQRTFPFISLARAADETNCTTTTSTTPKSFYAVAYDSADNSTSSPVLNIFVSTSSTSCVNANADGSVGGAS